MWTQPLALCKKSGWATMRRATRHYHLLSNKDLLKHHHEYPFLAGFSCMCFSSHKANEKTETYCLCHLGLSSVLGTVLAQILRQMQNLARNDKTIFSLIPRQLSVNEVNSLKTGISGLCCTFWKLWTQPKIPYLLGRVNQLMLANLIFQIQQSLLISRWNFFSKKIISNMLC